MNPSRSKSSFQEPPPPRYVSKRKTLREEDNDYSGLDSFSVNSPKKEMLGKHQKYSDFVPLFSKKKAENFPDEDEIVVTKKNQAPRPINVENLSEKQKELYNMSIFEKDLLHVKEKRQQIEQYEKENYREVDDFLTPYTQKTKISAIIEDLAKPRPRPEQVKYVEKPIRPITPQWYDQLNRHITQEEIREYQRQYLEQISQRVYYTEQPVDNRNSYYEQEYYEEDLNEDEKNDANYRITRSSFLKKNLNRLRVTKFDAEERQEKINSEMRTKAEMQAQKRMNSRPNKQRPVDNPEKSMRDKRTELRNNMEQYAEKLDNIKNITDRSQTLLERIEYDSMALY